MSSHFDDDAIHALLDSPREADWEKAFELIARAIYGTLAKIAYRYLRRHGFLSSDISFEAAQTTECFETLFDHVVEKVLLPEPLRRNVLLHDRSLGMRLLVFLVRRIYWICNDWCTANHRLRRVENAGADILLNNTAAATADESHGTSERSEEFDLCVAQLPTSQRAPLLLSIEPFYPMTTDDELFVIELTTQQGQLPAVTLDRIEDLRILGRNRMSEWKTRCDVVTQEISEFQALEKEVQFRRNRLQAHGQTAAQIQAVEDAAARSGQLQKVVRRYAGTNPHDSLLQDQKHLELECLRLAATRKKLDKARSEISGGPPTSPSLAIAGCLNWPVTKVDMALHRAKGSLKASECLSSETPPETSES